MSALNTLRQHRFEIALSFSKPHREVFRKLAEALETELTSHFGEGGRGRVFFDEWFEHELLGRDMDQELRRIYCEESLMVVAESSPSYDERPWTIGEARAIRDFGVAIDSAHDDFSRMRLLRIRFGNDHRKSELYTEGWVDGEKRTVSEIAGLILRRRTKLLSCLNDETSQPGERVEAHSNYFGTKSQKGSIERYIFPFMLVVGGVVLVALLLIYAPQLHTTTLVIPSKEEHKSIHLEVRKAIPAELIVFERASFRTELVRVVELLANKLEQAGQSAVGLGPISTNYSLGMPVVSELSQTITALMRRRGIQVNSRATSQLVCNLKVTKELISSSESQDGFVWVTVELSLQSEPERIYTISTSNEELVVEDLGLNVILPTTESPLSRNRIIQRAILDTGGRTPGIDRQADDSLSRLENVEVLVNGMPKEKHIVAGRPTVGLKVGDTFEIKVHNTQSYECAVSVHVDGINVLALPEETNGSEFYLIAPKSFDIIRGWRADMEGITLFKVANFNQGHAFQIGKANEVGKISVSFHAAWLEGGEPVEGEPLTKGDIAIARGKRVKDRVEFVPRCVGVLREHVTVYYERENR